MIGLNSVQKQHVLFRYKNKNTIAQIAKELGCPSIWVVWVLEGR